MKLKLKRAYEPAQRGDGMRILVDRLWPRGVSKSDAKIDLWLKDIAPSTPLRKWFNHDPAKWDKFRAKYAAELEKNSAMVEQFHQHANRGVVTLVYSAKDEQHNQAVALRDYLNAHA